MLVRPPQAGIHYQKRTISILVTENSDMDMTHEFSILDHFHFCYRKQ